MTKYILTEKQQKLLEFDIKKSNMKKIEQLYKLISNTYNQLSETNKNLLTDLLDEVYNMTVRVTTYSPEDIRIMHEKILTEISIITGFIRKDAKLIEDLYKNSQRV